MWKMNLTEMVLLPNVVTQIEKRKRFSLYALPVLLICLLEINSFDPSAFLEPITIDLGQFF